MLYTNNQILERDGLMKRTYFKSWKKRLRLLQTLRTRLDSEKGSTSNFGRKRTWTLTLNQTRFKSSQLGSDPGQVGSDLGQIQTRIWTKKDFDFDQTRSSQVNWVWTRSGRLRPRSGRLRTRSGRLRPGQVGSDQVRWAQTHLG